MVEVILKVLKAIWQFVKRVTVRICSFILNILRFFRDPRRIEKLKKKKERIAVAIKEKLETGDYNVVNCLFDTDTNEVVDAQTDAEIVSAERLDVATNSHFGDKDMIVLQ